MAEADCGSYNRLAARPCSSTRSYERTGRSILASEEILLTPDFWLSKTGRIADQGDTGVQRHARPEIGPEVR